MFSKNFQVLNRRLQRHNLLMIIASIVITLLALLFTIYWEYDSNDINTEIDMIYLFGSVFFLVISAALTALLIFARFYTFRTNALAIIIHVYFLLLMSWNTMMCVMDLRFGYSPIAYLMIITLMAGLFVVEPLFFTVILLSSATTVLVMAYQDNAIFFTGYAEIENVIYFITYFVVILLVGGEHFGMTINDYKAEKRLEQLTYYDDLTGLLNERSYLLEIEQLDKDIESGKIKEYAVILMDLNNLKATNDKYGHRYGCHLVVRCGHTLPDYFKTSKLFHVGGDEFVAIVLGEDYQNFDEVFKRFSGDLSYSLVEFDGQELIFSIAHGYAKYEDGLKYKDVLQKADDLMYQNKKMLKEKYHMVGR